MLFKQVISKKEITCIKRNLLIGFEEYGKITVYDRTLESDMYYEFKNL